MATLEVNAADFKNYGISVGRSSFTTMTGAGGFSASTNEPFGGLLRALVTDMTKGQGANEVGWQMYNGLPVAGNEIRDVSDLSNITKNFFTETNLSSTGTPYAGTGNFGVEVSGQRPAGTQHVVLLDSTDTNAPNRGVVSRGVDQSYRIRFEFDERPRLFVVDAEFPQELYQLNLRLRELGRPQYTGGNVIDESDPNAHLLDPTLNGTSTTVYAHPGYQSASFTLSANGTWEGTQGIPNPMYGWFKVNIGTKNQLLDTGFISQPIVSSDGLITLENGSTLNNSVIRNPGECVDVFFEDTILSATTQSLALESVTTGNGGASINEAGSIVGGTSGGGGTVDVNNSTGTVLKYAATTTTNFADGETITHSNGATAVITSASTTHDINRARRFRNKRKGKGWFKRFPKVSSDVGPSYPMSYRLTMTERGVLLYIFDDAAADQADDYAWFCAQRTVDNQTGITRTDEASRFPLHVLYSCSRESVYPRDFGVYFSTQAANLQTVENTLSQVFDAAGTSYNIDTIGNDAFYILNTYDREDSLADEFTAKNIWRFCAREFDVLKPWDVHKLATAHQTDSNAVINPLEQLAITDDNRFVITFPTGLTSQRFMYPKEEMDMICFSSAEVVAEGSNVPMQTYKPDGVTADQRRYTGLRATLANGNGMRLLALVNGQYIFNSDINLD